MSEEIDSKRLESGKEDYVTSAVKSVMGVVPFAGSLLAEIAGTIIPNQRVDRIVRFAEHLNERLSHLEERAVRAHLHNENFTDLIEESLRQAARAVSDERKRYIAALVANSIDSRQVSFIEAKHLLRVLNELNDIEILWLRYYLWTTTERDDAFREKHAHVFMSRHVHSGLSQEDDDDATIKESYKSHLEQLGLLERHYGRDSTTGLPEFDDRGLKPDGYELAPMGNLLLRQIGLGESDV